MESSKPLISVIVPVYNVEKYISRCIESIIAQTYNNWELILVDDGTPDYSGRICDDYAKKDMRIIVKHKTNEGVSAARNEGVCIASGEWIGFVDSDDYVERNWLQLVVDRIQQENGDVFVWGYTRECVQGTVYNTFIPEKRHFCDSYDFIKSKSYGHGMWLYLFNRNWIINYNCKCPEGIRRSEDQCFLLKYLCHNPRIITIQNTLYHYIDNPQSVANQKLTIEDIADNLRVATIFLNYVQNYKEVDHRFVKKVVLKLFEDYLDYVERFNFQTDKNAQNTYVRYYNQINAVDSHILSEVYLLLSRYSLKMGFFYINHLRGIIKRFHINSLLRDK